MAKPVVLGSCTCAAELTHSITRTRISAGFGIARVLQGSLTQRPPSISRRALLREPKRLETWTLGKASAPRVALLFVLAGTVRSMSDYDASRERMLREVKEGAASCADGDASDKIVLCRGCDPVMAARSKEFLPKMLVNVDMVMTTDDAAFFAAMQVLYLWSKKTF